MLVVSVKVFAEILSKVVDLCALPSDHAFVMLFFISFQRHCFILPRVRRLKNPLEEYI